MKYHSLARSADNIPDLNYKTWEKRNLVSRLLSVLAGVFSFLCVLSYDLSQLVWIFNVHVMNKT